MKCTGLKRHVGGRTLTNIYLCNEELGDTPRTLRWAGRGKENRILVENLLKATKEGGGRIIILKRVSEEQP
jgi:hypothetical protein